MPTASPPHVARERLLAGLYASELASRRDAYLEQHALPNSIRRQVSVFGRYLPFLPAAGDVLDWGCNHAPDACLARDALGPAVRLHGCDFAPPGRFPSFHGFARLDYTQLAAAGRLPYADASFDAVVGSGVLEHTANDSEALRELHRVLRDGGVLVVTFLPNRLSATEFLSRRLSRPAHLRLYGLREARRMLLHHGFEPVRAGYHQMLPAHAMQRFLSAAWPLNDALERVWPLNRLASNLMLVARRRAQLP